MRGNYRNCFYSLPSPWLETVFGWMNSIESIKGSIGVHPSHARPQLCRGVASCTRMNALKIPTNAAATTKKPLPKTASKHHTPPQLHQRGEGLCWARPTAAHRGSRCNQEAGWGQGVEWDPAAWGRASLPPFCHRVRIKNGLAFAVCDV